MEATKFTEVGYVGRDVESMVRDLVEAAIRICKAQRMEDVRLVAEAAAEQRLVELLVPLKRSERQPAVNPLQLLFGNVPEQKQEPAMTAEERSAFQSERERVFAAAARRATEHVLVEVDVEESPMANDAMFAAGIDLNLGDMLGSILPKKTKRAEAAGPRGAARAAPAGIGKAHRHGRCHAGRTAACRAGWDHLYR